ncbi:MAG: Fic family protein [Candidatus Micrarchaeota archaeon]
MYIERRKTKSGLKYYLSHTLRHFGKVKKFSIYLGKDLAPQDLAGAQKEAELKLTEKIKRYAQRTDPFYTEVEIQKDLLKEIRPSIRMFHLSEPEWEVFARLFTYNTNAIEGSTLSEDEVARVLQGKEVRAKESDVNEAISLRNAVIYLKKKPTVSVSTVKKLHKTVFGKTLHFAGKFRKVGVVIKDVRGNVIHRGFDWPDVPKAMRQIILWYNKNKTEYHPIVLAAVVHNRFEEVHPFQDGNGRIGRLLLNLILLSHDFPPVNIDLENRSKYYDALLRYDEDRDIRPMIKLIVREYTKMRNVIKGDYKSKSK